MILIKPEKPTENMKKWKVNGKIADTPCSYHIPEQAAMANRPQPTSEYSITKRSAGFSIEGVFAIRKTAASEDSGRKGELSYGQKNRFRNVYTPPHYSGRIISRSGGGFRCLG